MHASAAENAELRGQIADLRQRLTEAQARADATARHADEERAAAARRLDDAAGERAALEVCSARVASRCQQLHPFYLLAHDMPLRGLSSFTRSAKVGMDQATRASVPTASATCACAWRHPQREEACSHSSRPVCSTAPLEDQF